MTIDRNIPVPPKRGNGVARKYLIEALRGLKVNESTPDLIQSEADQQAVLMAARVSGIKVTTRKMETGGWRCWRIA